MRVWERGNGETAAAARARARAVVAAVENGLCDKDADITVRYGAATSWCAYTGEAVYLTATPAWCMRGVVEY
jgi:carbamoyl-phosphate synthase large subunit